MKAKADEIVRTFHSANAAEQSSSGPKLYLFYGPDQSNSQALAAKCAAALGPEAERVDMLGSELRNDIARLSDEAAAISLFGDKRYIRLIVNGDEANAAIENLLSSEAAGNPVIAIAGALTGRSKLVKLTSASPDAMTCVSYALNAQQADQMVAELARNAGLRISRDLTRQIAEISATDRALAAIEIEKIALYLDASPEEPAEVTPETVFLLAAATDEQDLNGLIGNLLMGLTQKMLTELQKLKALSVNEVMIVRALQRHVVQLSEMRAKVDQGQNIGDVVKSAFWAQQNEFAAQLRIWNSSKLSRLIERLMNVEAKLMQSGTAGGILLENELVTIVRVAERAR